MIAPNVESPCQQARLHYYDFLFHESQGLVPASVVDHIQSCQYCQDQLDQLEGLLSHCHDYADLGPRPAGLTVTTMLRLHFAYVGERVTCATVRPFLPSLLDPALKIRIPTPITAHLDNCQQCAEDLRAIRELRLSRKQLCRLSQLFAANPADDRVSCSRVQAVVPAVVSMQFSETDGESLNHLCTCPDCRERLYELRETARRRCLHEKTDRKTSLCDEVSATDIFDYVVPYGIDPADDRYPTFRGARVSHFRGCPTCLAKMQELHRMIYGIAERAEADVVTIFRVGKSAGARVPGRAADLYASFPIRVDITSAAEASEENPLALMRDIVTALKERVSTVNWRLLAKTGVVAALIFAAVALLFNVPTAGAFDEIYKALERVNNVHISKYDAQMRLLEEKWVSRARSIHMIKNAEGCVLRDLVNKVERWRKLEDNSLQTKPLSKGEIAETREWITGSLGLLPFRATSKIPSNARWSPATGEALEASSKDFEVYDLTWIQQDYSGPSIFRKWRLFVDAGTSLPHRIEIHRKSTTDSDYNLTNVFEVKYPDDNKVQAVIEKTSLQDM